jgi:hypothetical protein
MTDRRHSPLKVMAVQRATECVLRSSVARLTNHAAYLAGTAFAQGSSAGRPGPTMRLARTVVAMVVSSPFSSLPDRQDASHTPQSLGALFCAWPIFLDLVRELTDGIDGNPRTRHAPELLQD